MSLSVFKNSSSTVTYVIHIQLRFPKMLKEKRALSTVLQFYVCKFKDFTTCGPLFPPSKYCMKISVFQIKAEKQQL